MLSSDSASKVTGLILLAILNKVTATPALLVEGKAYKAGTRTLLYTEKYFLESDVKRVVVYYETDGREFARKTLDYSRAQNAPYFKQQNARLGELIQVTAGDNDNIKILYKSSTEAAVKESEIEVDDTLVIDAGFDYFIKHNWQALHSGMELDFNYLLPTRGTTVKLAMKKSNCKPALLCLKIYPANPLLGFFADDIKLQYSANAKQLLRFIGKSNIANSEGKYQNVNISYQHFPPTSKPKERGGL